MPMRPVSCRCAWTTGAGWRPTASSRGPSTNNTAAGLSVAETAAIVRRAAGSEGAAVDYLENTVAKLAEMGIRDRALQRVRDLAAAP